MKYVFRVYPGPEALSSAFGSKTSPVKIGRDEGLENKRRQRSSSSSSSSSSSGSSTSSSSLNGSKRKRRKKKSRRSRSKSNKTGDRKRDSVSPFSKRMPDVYTHLMGALAPITVNTLAPGVLPGVQVPLSTAAILPVNPYIPYPIENRPVSGVESEISRHSNEPGPPGEDDPINRSDSKADRPVASVVPAVPAVGAMYTMPPPGYFGLPPGYPPPITGYPPAQTHRDVEYERAVQKFLDQTSRTRDSRDERYRDDRVRRDYDHRRRPSDSDRRGKRKERKNSDERSRPTDSSDRRKRSSLERESSEQRSKRSSLEGKKDFLKMSVDEIAETVNVHYKPSQTTTSSRSKSRSRSRSHRREEKKGSKKDLDDSDKDDRKRKEKDQKSKEEDDRKKPERDDKRGFSPNAKKVFKMGSDESSEEEGEPEPVKAKGTHYLSTISLKKHYIVRQDSFTAMILTDIGN